MIMINIQILINEKYNIKFGEYYFPLLSIICKTENKYQRKALNSTTQYLTN